MSFRNKLCCIVYSVLLSSGTAVLADDTADWMNDGAPQLPKGVTSNDNSQVSKDSSAFSLTVQASRQMKSDHPNQALRLCHRALELDPDCAETHQVMAEAYERKYHMSGDEDNELFNAAVKEWLSVLRNDFGEEKGTSFHGIALPGIGGHAYEDDDRHRPARQHIIKLTGTQPKVWETNERFLKRIKQQSSGETSVSAKLLKDSEKAGDATTGKSATTKTAPAPSKSSASSAAQPH